MKTVCKRNQCTGCMLCFDICPQKAITIEDSISYINAFIDEDKCINCQMCYKNCMVNNSDYILNEPIKWAQGWNKNPHNRMDSSSGGVATAIETAFIEGGGIVCSCAFIDGCFKMTFASTIDELKGFKGSKYVKSNPSGVYKRINDLLRSNKKVLFVGLPCQVVAVKKAVKSEEKLYTIDLICHGTPSTRLLEYYFTQEGISLKDIKRIEFREKSKFNIIIDGGYKTLRKSQDWYSLAFLNGLSYTENCYSCAFAKTQRASDITLGDAWGSLMEKEEVIKGISLIICQSNKGKELIDISNLEIFDIDKERAIDFNGQLREAYKEPKARDEFFDMVFSNESMEKILFRVLPYKYFKNLIKELVCSIKTKKSRGGGTRKTIR